MSLHYTLEYTLTYNTLPQAHDARTWSTYAFSHCAAAPAAKVSHPLFPGRSGHPTRQFSSSLVGSVCGRATWRSYFLPFVSYVVENYSLDGLPRTTVGRGQWGAEPQLQLPSLQPMPTNPNAFIIRPDSRADSRGSRYLGDDWELIRCTSLKKVA